MFWYNLNSILNNHFNININNYLNNHLNQNNYLFIHASITVRLFELYHRQPVDAGAVRDDVGRRRLVDGGEKGGNKVNPLVGNKVRKEGSGGQGVGRISTTYSLLTYIGRVIAWYMCV